MKLYNLEQVVAIFGPHILSGWAEGSAIKAERNEDAFTLQVGATGDATRSKTNNRSGKVTFTLQQTSASNLYLSGVHAADELSPNGDGIMPLIIKDLQGYSLVTAEKAWIVKTPAHEDARDSGNREWVIESDNLVIVEGGN